MSNIVYSYCLIIRRTATRSCRTRKRVVHVYSPGVPATRHVWPAAATAAAVYICNVVIKS